jgi:hypothetical protein
VHGLPGSQRLFGEPKNFDSTLSEQKVNLCECFVNIENVTRGF